MSNPYNIAHTVRESDLVIGAVLIPGAKAPKLVSTDIIQSMEPGSVIVDVAIDQGGIFLKRRIILQHTTIQPISSMALFIMLWRICRELCRVPQPLPSQM
ncbi:hypothetical protein GCM10020331_031930 [Ectobacillus funiculus]